MIALFTTLRILSTLLLNGLDGDGVDRVRLTKICGFRDRVVWLMIVRHFEMFESL